MLAHYVVQTHNLQEELAHNEIRLLGFESVWFSTREEYRVKNGRRFKIVSTFPSYIFVAFDVDRDKWEPITKRRGVKNILGPDPLTPFALKPGTIDEIRERIEYKPPTFIDLPRSPIEAGDKVIVDTGGSEIKVGVCKFKKDDRVRILMEYLGGEREVEMWVGRVRLLSENCGSLRN